MGGFYDRDEYKQVDFEYAGLVKGVEIVQKHIDAVGWADAKKYPEIVQEQPAWEALRKVALSKKADVRDKTFLKGTPYGPPSLFMDFDKWAESEDGK